MTTIAVVFVSMNIVRLTILLLLLVPLAVIIAAIMVMTDALVAGFP